MITNMGCIWLSDHLPLKQGLKLLWPAFFFCRRKLSDHLPLKQGLKPPRILRRDFCVALSDHLPLKQGLKPYKNTAG